MNEAQRLGDRIGLMAGGQLVLCGSRNFIEEKFDHSMKLVFQMVRTVPAGVQQARENLEFVVRSMISQEFTDKVTLSWNAKDQLEVKLPNGLTHKDLERTISMDQLHDSQGQLFESLEIKIDSLA